MNEFTVKLADERGRVQEQTHAAANAEELRSRFTQAGYLVYSVKAKSSLGRQTKKKVKLDMFLVFNQQFLTLIRAGLPILSSLDLLAKRQKDVAFRAQLEDVGSRVKTGESISSAFEAQGTVPLVYTTTLLAGERSGNLEEVLQRYLDFQRVSLTFRKKLRASLIYPAFLVVMVIGLFVFLITFVVPQFRQALRLGSAPKLPALTLGLLAFGDRRATLRPYTSIPAVGSSPSVYLIVFRWSSTEAGIRSRSHRQQSASGCTGSSAKSGSSIKSALFSPERSPPCSAEVCPSFPRLETAAKSHRFRAKVSPRPSTYIGRAGSAKAKASQYSLERRPVVFPELSTEMVEVGEIDRRAAADA